MKFTQNEKFIKASRVQVFDALLNAELLPKWKVPDNMTCQVHQFEAKTGGSIRVSLTYRNKKETGKSSSHTDTYHGKFLVIEPHEKIIELDEFETDNPDMKGRMKITLLLEDVPGGTQLKALHEGLPVGVSIVDNETGWGIALDKLARLVETRFKEPQ